jgi:hypothetical protein
MNGKLALPFVLLPALCLGACGSLGDLTLIDLRTQKAQDELRVVVEYTSTKDLSQFDILGGEFFLCARPDANLRLGPLSQKPGWDPRAPLPEKFYPPQKRGPPPYQAIFRASIVENTIPSDNPPFESFDLRQQPQDVCFRLKEGPYSALGAWSGILTIPKERIFSVLSQSEAAVK